MPIYPLDAVQRGITGVVQAKIAIDDQGAVAKINSLKKATPIAYQATLDSTVGTKHIFTFNLKFERGPGKERLTFTRSKNGEMQLWDLVMNQESDHPITRYNVNIAHKISLSVNTETQAEFRKAWS